jgi:hypothetical protein
MRRGERVAINKAVQAGGGEPRERIWSDILKEQPAREMLNHPFIAPCQEVAMCPVPSVAVVSQGKSREPDSR